MSEGSTMRHGGLEIAATSDVGLRRSRNEDAFVVWAPEDPAALARHGVLLAVADGMGGANAGDVASALAIETVAAAFRAAPGDDPAAALRASLAAANARIVERSRADATTRGMGATCTALAVRGADVVFAHVGDSRAYLVRDGVATALTRDHTLVAELVAAGVISAGEAGTDPRRHMLTRCLGTQDAVEIDGGPCARGLRVGDALVVCSDGLHGVLDEARLAAIVAGHAPAEACARLVAGANDAGGPDNITVIVARVAAD